MDEEREKMQEEELREIIDASDSKRLSEYFDNQEPVDFAQTVSLIEDEDELRHLLSILDDDELASLMEESEDRMRLRIARLLNDRRLLVAFEYMQKDDIVDMLGDFPIGRRKKVINLMKADDRRVIQKLLDYPEDSAGGLMTTEYIALKETLSIEKALKKIQEIGPRTEVIETIYVIDDRRRLVGCVDLRVLLSEPKDTLLGNIMEENPITVYPETDQEETAQIVSKYDLMSLPVVSRTNQILGIITVDDIIDVIVDEYDADMLQMAGVSGEESLDTTLGESIRFRLPWLLVNLATAFLASFVVKMFQSTIEQVVALSAIMTIISGMGGNAGSQTMSILVRQLAQGEITLKRGLKAFRKEMELSIINGSVNGFVTGVIVVFMYHNFYLGIITLAAMIGNMIVSGIFGFLIPIILHRLKADPAVASSIFVTTATDVLGFFIFLGLAKLFLPVLI
ncbi:MAG: magnesium transporter [Eubacteriales bacterium]|nr:magnesium transporter [Eubacteriales bacterium]